jgi:type I restriction enzyme S subunit
LDELGAEFRYGTSVKSSTIGKPTLRIPNVIGGSIDLSDLKLVPVTNEEFERLRLFDGDFLFVRTNGNPDFVGRCALFDSRQILLLGLEADQFIYASYLIRARIPHEEVEPVFLRDYLLGAEGRRRLRARCKTSAGQYNINTEGLGAIAVPLPAYILQREFAERVEGVERVRAIHRTATSEIDVLFASLQHRAFRGEL